MTFLLASIWLFLAFVLCFAGCAFLALSQTRNWRAVVDDRKSKPPRVAKLGWTLVLLGLVPCIVRDGASFAALEWPLVFAAAAMSTAMILAYRPSVLRPATRILTKGP